MVTATPRCPVRGVVALFPRFGFLRVIQDHPGRSGIDDERAADESGLPGAGVDLSLIHI